MAAQHHALSRRIRTGVGFAAVAVEALWLSLVVLPWARRRRGGAADELFAQRAIHRGCRRVLDLSQRLGVLRWPGSVPELAGGGPRLIVANHPTLADVLVLGALLPQVDCIVNSRRARNPILRGVVRAAGYITNAGGPEAVAACVRRLAEGRTVLIFPEGTRSPVGRLGRFQRGAAHVALRSGVPLTPVVLDCDPPTLKKGQPWYDVTDRPFVLTARVLPAVAPDGARASGGSTALAARRLTAELREHFEKNLAPATDGGAEAQPTGEMQPWIRLSKRSRS